MAGRRPHEGIGGLWQAGSAVQIPRHMLALRCGHDQAKPNESYSHGSSAVWPWKRVQSNAKHDVIVFHRLTQKGSGKTCLD